MQLRGADAAPRRAAACGGRTTQRVRCSASALPSDWRKKAKPISPGSSYPAKEHCSSCGLCDTYYIAHVKDACAFLGDGMSRIEQLEERVHGRRRRLDVLDEVHFGVYDDMFYAKKVPGVEGAQWTGIVTSIALEMLRSGKVDGVVCVQSQDDNRLVPKPILATTPEEILASRGVKPSLSPNLNVLAEVEARGIKKLLFIGVGCAVQALRSVEQHLGLDALYVLGTNCTDNGTPAGLQKFLQNASVEPETVTGYEFMQDYQVHIKHTTDLYEKIPYFCLPASKLKDVIAPSCYSCFDYANNLADMTVGYMGVPYEGVEMTSHMQYVTVRNGRGKELLDAVRGDLQITPAMSSGDRTPFVVETVLSDDRATLGEVREPAPMWLGKALAWALEKIGPKGLEFGRYSLDYHTIRNYLYVVRTFPADQAARHVPSYAKKLVEMYDKDGAISKRLAMGRKDV